MECGFSELAGDSDVVLDCTGERQRIHQRDELDIEQCDDE